MRGGVDVAFSATQPAELLPRPVLKHTPPPLVSASGWLGPAARGITAEMQKLQENKIDEINLIKSSVPPGAAGPGWPGARSRGAGFAAAGAGPCLSREGKKKSQKGINRDMFLLGNISDGIKGDYISRSAGIYPGSYGFNLLSPRPFYDPRRGGYRCIL